MPQDMTNDPHKHVEHRHERDHRRDDECPVEEDATATPDGGVVTPQSGGNSPPPPPPPKTSPEPIE